MKVADFKSWQEDSEGLNLIEYYTAVKILEELQFNDLKGGNK